MNKKRILVVSWLIFLLAFFDMFAYVKEIQTYVMVDGVMTRNPYPHEIIKYFYEDKRNIRCIFLFSLLVLACMVIIGLLQEAKDNINDSVVSKNKAIIILFFSILLIAVMMIPILKYMYYKLSYQYLSNALTYFVCGFCLSLVYEICQIQLQKRLKKEILHTNKIGEVFKYLFLILGIPVFFVYASFFLNTPFYSKENTPSMPALMSVYCLFGGLLGAELFSIFYKSKCYNSIKNIQFKDLINKLLEKP